MWLLAHYRVACQQQNLSIYSVSRMNQVKMKQISSYKKNKTNNFILSTQNTTNSSENRNLNWGRLRALQGRNEGTDMRQLSMKKVSHQIIQQLGGGGGVLLNSIKRSCRDNRQISVMQGFHSSHRIHSHIVLSLNSQHSELHLLCSCT